MFKSLKLILNIFFVICLFSAINCAGIKPFQAEDIVPDFKPAKHLVFIGLDGWGGAYMSGADMPVVNRMMAKGASSLYQYSEMPSDSKTNWTALFTGVPPERYKSEIIPSIFAVINEKYKASSVLFHEWDWMSGIVADEVTEKFSILSDLESTKSIAAYIIKNKPVFTAIVFNEPDFTAHKKKWGSASYYDKLTEMDSYIAIIEQAVKDAGIYDETVFILSSDHGGSFLGHGQSFSKHRRIPIVIYGSIIKEGYVIPERAGICSVTPTMALILGLEIPSEWTEPPLTGIFR